MNIVVCSVVHHTDSFTLSNIPDKGAQANLFSTQDLKIYLLSYFLSTELLVSRIYILSYVNAKCELSKPQVHSNESQVTELSGLGCVATLYFSFIHNMNRNVTGW
jgi:hypothetical protein